MLVVVLAAVGPVLLLLLLLLVLQVGQQLCGPLADWSAAAAAVWRVACQKMRSDSPTAPALLPPELLRLVICQLQAPEGWPLLHQKHGDSSLRNPRWGGAQASVQPCRPPPAPTGTPLRCGDESCGVGYWGTQQQGTTRSLLQW